MNQRVFLVLLFLIFSWTLSHAEATYPPFFGVMDNKLTYDQSLRSKAAETGAKWVREFVFWSDIEPNAPVSGLPSYNWSKYDGLFLDYQSKGLTVIAVLGGIPLWAGLKPYGPITRMADFKRFVSDLVQRYDGNHGLAQVRFYEFFNEPDLRSGVYAGDVWGYWSQRGGGWGGDYVQILKEIYTPLKTANPDASVVLGGLALEDIGWDSNGIMIFNLSFLNEVLAAGGGPYFDVMNFHYYTAFKNVWERYGKDILGKLAYVKSVFTQYGVSQKPVFVTEAGEWSSTWPDCSPGYGRNEEVQARYAMKLYVRGTGLSLGSPPQPTP